jgi:hypothetical protein
MHNFYGGPQDGACVLYADLWPYGPHPVIIDKTSVKMGETVHNADTVSIALQGAFINNFYDPTYDRIAPINEIAVACTTGEADVGESVLTVIPFQGSPTAPPTFTCHEGKNIVNQSEPCTPNDVTR